MLTKSYFISDMHLGAKYISNPREHEKKITKWLDSIADDAMNLFLLGDIMDYWYEYRTVAPRGFIRFLAALTRLSDNGTNIYWFKGNHDIWLFDYLSTEIGLTVVDGAYECVLNGKRFLLEHGDGVGKIDTGYSLMRRVFRSKLCQHIYSAIHPRWTIAFAHGWSSKSRRAAPEASRLTVEKDVKRLMLFAKNRNDANTKPAVDYFIFGHLHLPMTIEIEKPKATITILGDCFKQFSFAEWDGMRLKSMEF